MKRTIVFILVIAMSLSCLAGCHKHTYSEATCTTLATCTECGETTGELAEHIYSDATYQSGPTCINCGEVNGDKLKAGFEEKGLTKYLINLSDYSGSSFIYHTPLWNNNKKTLNLKSDVSWIKVIKKEATGNTTILKSFYTPDNVDFKFYETDVNKFPELDGYEWRACNVQMNLSSNDYGNYYYNGIRWYTTLADYYTGDFLCDDYTEINGENRTTFSVNYNGIDYDDCMAIGWTKFVDKGSLYSYIEDYSFVRVPVGYDGIVAAYIDTTGYDDAFYESDLPLEDVIVAGVTFIRFI